MTESGHESSDQRLSECKGFESDETEDEATDDPDGREKSRSKKRSKVDTEDEATDDPDGREKSRRKKRRKVETENKATDDHSKKRRKFRKKRKNGSSSSSNVTGLSSPDHTPLLRSSSSVGSASNKPSPYDAGKMVITRNLDKEFSGEGEILVMKPELRTAIKHLEEMSKKNRELEVGLEMFRSTVKFLNTILLIKGQTKDVKPSEKN